MLVYIYALLCVIAIAAGQLLFKLTAHELNQGTTLFNIKALIYFSIAIVIYGLTSIGWVTILKKTELGRIYPLMALAFLLVPLGSYIYLGERFQPHYFLGVALIIVGIIITIRP
jgi:drug/metabolite transporter (DMT)-like permease